MHLVALIANALRIGLGPPARSVDMITVGIS